MSPILLALGAAKVLVKNRKLQLALIGVQFAYVTYRMISERKDNTQNKLKKRRKAISS